MMEYITIRKSMVRFSSGCLNGLPKAAYILFVINPTERLLRIEPCTHQLHDSIRWCSAGKCKPKTIICKEFYNRLRNLMGWDEAMQYVVFGRITSVMNFSLDAAIPTPVSIKTGIQV